MKIAPDLESYTLFLVLVVPGLISMHVYRLLFAAREIDWKGGLIQASYTAASTLLSACRFSSQFTGMIFWRTIRTGTRQA